MGAKASKIAKNTPLAPPPAPGLGLVAQPSIVGADSPVALTAKVPKVFKIDNGMSKAKVVDEAGNLWFTGVFPKGKTCVLYDANGAEVMTYSRDDMSKPFGYILAPDGSHLATITFKSSHGMAHQEMTCEFTNTLNGERVMLSAIGNATDMHLVAGIGELREGQTGILRVTTPFFSISPHLEVMEGVDVAIAIAWVVALKGCGGMIPWANPWIGNN